MRGILWVEMKSLMNANDMRKFPLGKKDKKELIHCAAMAKLFGFLCTKDITLEKKWLICKMIYGDPHVPMTARINDPFRFRFFIIRKISNVWCFFCLNWALKRILCWWDIKESFQLIDKKGNNEITKKEKKLEKKRWHFFPTLEWFQRTNSVMVRVRCDELLTSERQ